eukprot:366134-Chlamydomonas_euryale.AAC.8
MHGACGEPDVGRTACSVTARVMIWYAWGRCRATPRTGRPVPAAGTSACRWQRGTPSWCTGRFGRDHHSDCLHMNMGQKPPGCADAVRKGMPGIPVAHDHEPCVITVDI